MVSVSLTLNSRRWVGRGEGVGVIQVPKHGIVVVGEIKKKGEHSDQRTVKCICVMLSGVGRDGGKTRCFYYILTPFVHQKQLAAGGGGISGFLHGIYRKNHPYIAKSWR